MWKFAITTITLDKNFVKANDEKKRKEITNSLTFFRQINGFTKEVTELGLTKFFERGRFLYYFSSLSKRSYQLNCNCC